MDAEAAARTESVALGAARALSVRLFLAALATQESMAAYLGVKLGLYESLHRDGPATVAQLVSRTGLAPRYLREWLEQQAVCGLLDHSDPFGSADARVYRLPPGHERVLVASDDPLSLVSGALMPIGGVAAALPHLLQAFATGAGVPDEVFGDDWRQGHGGANRALYTHQLAGWLRHHAPHVVAPQRIADIGCGAGWASLALARAFPSATVVGYDLDAPAVAEAALRAKETGLADRVSFEVADAVTLTGRFDLVCLFDTLHELPAPVEVLRACRTLRADGGTVLVMDAHVADRFTAPGDEVERFQYATSLLHCLPAGLAAEGSTAQGTVMRLAAVRSLVRSAGYTDLRYVDLDDRFHRLYELIG